MPRRPALAIAAVAVLAGGLVLGVGPASAGGSSFAFEGGGTDPTFAPGETVRAWAPVAWEHDPALGTPDDGPYTVWLAPVDDDEVGGGTVAAVPLDATIVGPLEISLDPYDTGTLRFGPHHATATFAMPDLAPGRYVLGHCDSPCTTLLGDLWGAELSVTAPAPGTATVVPASVAGESAHGVRGIGHLSGLTGITAAGARP